MDRATRTEARTRAPLHPLFVHFPIALWTAGLLLDVASLRGGRPLVVAGFYSMLLGTLFVLPTAIAGLLDYTKLQAGTRTKSAAGMHAVTMLLASLGMVVSTWLHFAGAAQDRASIAAMIVGGLSFLVMTAGAVLGHQLVFHFGANVQMPAERETEREAPVRPRVPVKP